MDFLNDLTKKDWIILGVGITVGAVLMYGYNRYCPLGRIDYEESKKPKKIRKTSKNEWFILACNIQQIYCKQQMK